VPIFGNRRHFVKKKQKVFTSDFFRKTGKQADHSHITRKQRQEWGRKGARMTRKITRKQRQDWGRKGGRPKKHVPEGDADGQ